MITSGYEKETKVTLRPRTESVVKDKDKLYLVREKSKERSTSRNRRGSWMFT